MNQIYQVAVELGFKLTGKTWRRLNELYRNIDEVLEEIPMSILGDRRVAGDYDSSRHIFYAGKPNSSEKFGKKIGGLEGVKGVHIDKVPDSDEADLLAMFIYELPESSE